MHKGDSAQCIFRMPFKPLPGGGGGVCVGERDRTTATDDLVSSLVPLYPHKPPREKSSIGWTEF
jgi:hypothetical protein